MNTLIKKHNYNGKCWWCGLPADSEEHLYKRTDFTSLFQNYVNKNQATLLKEGGKRKIQGPKSKILTFKKILCESCNNKRSQPFDFAYEKFIKYVQQNPEKIIENGFIDFKDIFNSIDDKENLYKYFVKHFCCVLSQNNIFIEQSLIDFLNSKESIPQFLFVKFEFDYDKYIFEKRINEFVWGLGKTGLHYVLDKFKDAYQTLHASYEFKWFQIHFIYSKKIISSNFKELYNYYSSNVLPVQILRLLKCDEYKTLSLDYV